MMKSPRIPYINPENMTEEQKIFYDDVVKNLGDTNAPHIWMLEEGQINGPFTSMLHYPEIGYLLYKLQLKIVKQTLIPKDIFEVFILMIVAAEGAAYGIYAHELLAEKNGVPREIIKAVKDQKIPDGLDERMFAACSLAAALSRPGPLPQKIYEETVGKFGADGYNMFVNTAAIFKYLGTLMNAYDEPVPKGGNSHGDQTATVFQAGM